MLFSIVTPSFRNSAWLRLCIASVADQQGVEHEHLVQDAGSDDGTQKWLPHDPRVRAFVERDEGMYDAINRGLRRASGDIVAYLNCDEQYLPGALRAVQEAFVKAPEVDVLVADLVVVDALGAYVCHRRSMAPVGWHLWHRFNITTASLFIRRRVFHEHGLWFDPRWRSIGDFFWILEAHRRGLKWQELRCFASAFTETGQNMHLQSHGRTEDAERLRLTPPLLRRLEPIIGWHHRLRMLVRGSFTQRRFRYQLYTLSSPERRVTFEASKPTGRWIGRS